MPGTIRMVEASNVAEIPESVKNVHIIEYTRTRESGNP